MNSSRLVHADRLASMRGLFPRTFSTLCEDKHQAKHHLDDDEASQTANVRNRIALSLLASLVFFAVNSS